MAYTAVFPNEVSIFIQAAATNGSALVAGDKVVGEITNWKVNGGAIAKDLVNVFGGQLDIRKPREMIEISFDIYANNLYTSALQRWHTYNMSDGTSASLPVQKAVFLSALSNGNWQTFAFNYADVTTSDIEQASDEALKQTITMKIVPQSTLGVANMKSSTLAYSTSFFNW
jgi:hypothetical protein